MARRTLNLPGSVEAVLEDNRKPGESFSATASRLIRFGAEAIEGKKRRPRYVSSGEGPGDLGRKAEEYLREVVTQR